MSLLEDDSVSEDERQPTVVLEGDGVSYSHIRRDRPSSVDTPITGRRHPLEYRRFARLI